MDYDFATTLREFLASARPDDLAVATLDEAPGAIKNGTKIRKVRSRPGDGHQDGAEGVVIGSIAIPPDTPISPEDRDLAAQFPFVYFVIWDDVPQLPVGVTGWRIEAVPTN